VTRFVSRPGRVLSAVGTVLLLGASLSVLYHVTDVAGDPRSLFTVVAGAVLASTLLARLLRPRVALVVALALLVAGGSWYFTSLPDGIEVLRSADVLASDALALLSGLSVLQITNAGQWALAVAPAPVFLAWYLFVRRQYAASALVGGGLLGLFVLTGDASVTTTLFGVVGAAALVGFGDLDRRRGGLEGADVVTVVLAAMVVATLTLGVLPAGAGTTLDTGSGGGTVEGSIVSTDDRVRIQGAISLSPEVRFTVESEAPEYWTVGTYDRFTGGEWLRTGGTRPYDGRLAGPPGRDRPLEQRYEAESRIDTMPAAWKPVDVEDSDVPPFVTNDGTFRPQNAFEPGDSYRVESRVLLAGPEELRRAGTDYPERVTERYLQLPASTPDRVARRTDRITANADNPYDTARVVESWLGNNRNYSLDVERPEGNIADAFLFEMERGYCTYYASTMVTMLRTQGIPARFVVGYTTGQQVSDDRYVVRGLDSHAWVEVYFPDQGWVRFDPTPAGPRQQAEQARLAEARSEEQENVDTDESEPTPTPTPDPAQPTTNATTPEGNVTTPNTTIQNPFGTPVDTDTGGGGPELPSREQLGLGLIVAAGAVAGLRRTGTASRLYREFWLRQLPDGPPSERIAGAYERLEYLLGERARPREPGETPRQYLEAVTDDMRAHRIGTLHERATYAGTADEGDAQEAARLLEELVGQRSLRERFGP
jgi:transglutaminase-like putative cysteine protease